MDSNGNVVVTGSSYNATIKDYYTVKYAAADGAVLWEKRYDGAEIDYSDAGPALALDISGNVVVTGHSYSNQDSYDYYTAKYAAADGTLLWEKRYDGPANDSFDFAQALALDGSGNVVVTGVSTDSSEVLSQGWFRFSQYYTAKYAGADGTLLWERRYNANAAFIPYWGSTPEAAVAVDDSGNIILIGSSFTGDEPSRATPDYYTAKYAAGDGTLLWESSYNGTTHHESHPVAVTMDSSGNVVRTATSGYGSSTAKYAASNGALLWEKLTPDTVTQVALDGSGSVVVTGSSYSGWESDDYYYTAKYAADGGLLWKRRAPGTDIAFVLDGNGNVVVAGLISSSENYTAKYAGSNGALLWEKRYPGPGSSDRAHAVAVDTKGDVAVTGNSNAAPWHDFYTAKYAASDGSLLWEKRENGSAFADSAGRAVAMDSSGNVVVLRSNATLKYAGADGALLWEKRNTDSRAMALDDGGNVAITGSFGTRRLAAADGASLWAKPFSKGYSTALSIDSNGNVVVTGQKGDISGYLVLDGQSVGSLYTVKYAAADGALLWEKSYKEPGSFGHSAAGPHSLALGPNGMIAIIGTSSLSATGPADVLTVMFREGLSALSVEPLLTGIRLSFTGTAGQSYSIQRAPTVSGPWSTLETQFAPPSGVIQYEDETRTPSAAFYRTTAP